MFSRNPPFVKISDKAKDIVKKNKIKIKEIDVEIQRLYDKSLDMAGYLRHSLAKDRRVLMNENTKIRKGFIIIN